MPQYRATKHEDGKFSIFGVPVMGTLPKGARGNDREFGREWMEAAIDRCRQRESEGYRFRLHVFHHERGSSISDKPQPAGTFTLTGIKTLKVGGKDMDVLHADLHNIDQYTFERIQSGELLYRSAEILNPKGEPEVDSIALLSTETPFFRLPVTSAETVTLDESNEPALAAPVGFYAHDGQAALIFHANGISTEESMPKTMTLALENGALVGKLESGAVFRAAESDEPRQKEFVLKTPEGDYVAHFAAVEDEDAAKLRAENAKLSARIEAHEATMKAAANSGSAVTFTFADGSFAWAEAGNDPDPAPKNDAVKLQARLDALEAETAERKAKDRAKERADAALLALKSDGWHVPERCKESIVRFAAESDDSILDSYVEEFKATRPKDPVRLSGAGGEIVGDANVPDEVLKFNADGPDAFEKAMGLSSEYDSLAAAGMARGLTREAFIESHMKPLAVRS